ncbi:MAG: hypothetical protein ACOC2D_14670 [Spirochaetota bacterium]
MSTDVARRLRRLPRIRRARGYRLSSVDGRRLLDMWQAGGRAILGHRGADVTTALKRTLDRGVTEAFPSVQEHRLEQALHRLLGEAAPFSLAVYATRERALNEVSRSLGLAPGRLVVVDPATGEAVAPGAGATTPSSSDRSAATGGSDAPPGRPAPHAALWRPFLAGDPWEVAAGSSRVPAGARASVLLPVLPCGGLVDAQAVLTVGDERIGLESDLLPEAVLVALTAAADALVSAAAPPVIALPGFAARGPYCVPAAAPDYDALFERFLAAGIVLSPDPAVPSIVPGELSDGERRQIERTASLRRMRGQ